MTNEEKKGMLIAHGLEPDLAQDGIDWEWINKLREGEGLRMYYRHKLHEYEKIKCNCLFFLQ